jgi:hypothetical protein
MYVWELREILAELPENSLVVLAKDGEGNGFSPLSGYSDEDRYLAEEGDWQGELVSAENCDDERALYGEKVPCDHSDCRWSEGVNAVFLWPVN